MSDMKTPYISGGGEHNKRIHRIAAVSEIQLIQMVSDFLASPVGGARWRTITIYEKEVSDTRTVYVAWLEFDPT